jgi:16S rRNA (adenine1518-N6/adenine1519-N6)-dimethyltransferase
VYFLSEYTSQDSHERADVIKTPPQKTIHLKKSLGQHVIVSHRGLNQMVKALRISPEDVVIEVGPGTGVLTRELLPLCRKVIAIELDEGLATKLPPALGNPPNLNVVKGDARDCDPEALLAKRVPYKVVGNLPYYAAAPIIRSFLEADWKPTLMVVTVQREVAQNIVAKPGNMSLIAIGVQCYAKPKILCYLPPSAFRPPPKVASAVLALEVLPKPAVDVINKAAFFALVRAGFAAPRKQLRNALATGLKSSPSQALRLLDIAGINPTRRAETLTIQEWQRLYRVWRNNGN